MPSSATDLLRLQKMATGEKVNTWGAELNDTVIELLEDAIAGWETITITGNTTLTSVNYAADQARKAALNLTGSPASGFTLTIPGVSKVYWIRNATGQTATISAGGTTCSVYTGELIAIVTDGTDCYRHERNRQDQALHMGGNKITNLATPTADTDAATKAYADTTIAAAAASAAAALASETAAAASATAAANSFDAFDDKYLGAKSSAPTLDNDGDPLATGALYLNSVTQLFYVWTGAAWQGLGTGTISTQDSDAVAITGGSITGITDLAIADGGTGASTAAGARTNLGLDSMALQAADAVAITGGTIAGVTISSSSTTGNFGFGEASPQAPVHVTAASGHLYLEESDAAVDEKVWTVQAQNAVLSIQTRDDSYGFLGTIWRLNRSGQLESQLGSAAAPTYTHQGDTDTGAYSPGADQWAVATGGALAFSIDASQNAAFAGTLTTTGDLSIHSADSADMRLRPGADVQRSSITFENAAGTEQFSILNVPNNNYLAFRYAGIDGFNLTSTGDVGIGTGTPLAKLHVEGVSNGELLRLASTVPDRGLTVTQYAIGGINQTGYEFDARGAGGTAELSFKTASALALTLDSNQNAAFEGDVTIPAGQKLGVGTTSPDQALHLHSSGNTHAKISTSWTGPNSSARFVFDSENDPTGVQGFTFQQAAVTQGALSFQNAVSTSDRFFDLSTGSSRLRAYANGRFAINKTSAPSTTLDVYGSGAFESSHAVLTLRAITTANTSRLYFGNTHTSDLRGAIFYAHTDDSMALWTAGAVALTIGANKNVVFEGKTYAQIASAASPAYSFDGDDNTGAYSPGADQYGIATGGVQAVAFDASQNASFAGDITATGTIGGLDSAELGELGNIGTTTISAAQWAYLGSTDQALATTDDVTFADLTATGQLRVGEGSALSVTTNAITPTHSLHEINSGGATQTINTINGGAEGAVLVLRGADAYEDTVNFGTSGNIYKAVTLTGPDIVTLIYSSLLSKWVPISVQT